MARAFFLDGVLYPRMGGRWCTVFRKGCPTPIPEKVADVILSNSSVVEVNEEYSIYEHGNELILEVYWE